jgi:hypothetical protein
MKYLPWKKNQQHSRSAIMPMLGPESPSLQLVLLFDFPSVSLDLQMFALYITGTSCDGTREAIWWRKATKNAVIESMF